MSKHQRRRNARPVCPLCAKPRPDHGLPLTIPFGIPTYWSSETAFAVFEFIDEMRTIILAAYETRIQSEAQRSQQYPMLDRAVIPDDEVPF
jgi:hypothetical protein